MKISVNWGASNPNMMICHLDFFSLLPWCTVNVMRDILQFVITSWVALEGNTDWSTRDPLMAFFPKQSFWPISSSSSTSLASLQVAATLQFLWHLKYHTGGHGYFLRFNIINCIFDLIPVFWIHVLMLTLYSLGFSLLLNILQTISRNQVGRVCA